MRFLCVCGVIDSLMLNVHRRREREGGRVVVVVGEVCVRGWGSEGWVGGMGWGVENESRALPPNSLLTHLLSSEHSIPPYGSQDGNSPHLGN